MALGASSAGSVVVLGAGDEGGAGSDDGAVEAGVAPVATRDSSCPFGRLELAFVAGGSSLFCEGGKVEGIGCSGRALRGLSDVWWSGFDPVSSTETGAREGKGLRAPGDVRYVISWRHCLRYSRLRARALGSRGGPVRFFHALVSGVGRVALPATAALTRAEASPFSLVGRSADTVSAQIKCHLLQGGGLTDIVAAFAASAALLVTVPV